MASNTTTNGTKTGNPTAGVQRAPITPTAVGKASEGVGPIPAPKTGYLCGVSVAEASAKQTAEVGGRVDDAEIALACSLYIRCDVLKEKGATDRSLGAEIGRSHGTVGNYRRLGRTLAELGFISDTPEGYTDEMRQTALKVRKVMMAHTSQAKLLAANGGKALPKDTAKAIAAWDKMAGKVTTERERETKALRSGKVPTPNQRKAATPEQMAKRAEDLISTLSERYVSGTTLSADTLRHLNAILRHFTAEREGVSFTDYVFAHLTETETAAAAS